MSTNLAALTFALLAIGLAMVISPKALDRKRIVRIGFAWAVLAAFAFLIPSDFISLLGAGVFIAVLAPKAASERVGFFVSILPAVPIYHVATIPFPGLNYLLDINFGLVSILVLLAPTLLMKSSVPLQKSFGTAQFLVIAYALIISLLDFRALPFTSVLRETFVNVVVIAGIYLAVSRSIRTRQDFDDVLSYLLVSLIFIASVGVMSFLRDWNFYAQLADGSGFIQFADYRSGMLRIQSTLMASLLGYLMAFGCVLTYNQLALGKLQKFQAAGLCALFLFVLVLSGSRGAFLAAFVMFGAYTAYRILPGLTRMVMFPAVTLIFVIGISWLSSGRIDTVAKIDQYGTFDYRIALLRASFKQIREHPFWGEADYLNGGNFFHLIQGQGIIDIVNTYLQIALGYGLVALLFFTLPFIIVLRSLSKSSAHAARVRGSADSHAVKNAPVLIAAITSFLILLMTVSDTSYLIHYAFILLALSKAYATICVQDRKIALGEINTHATA